MTISLGVRLIIVPDNYVHTCDAPILTSEYSVVSWFIYYHRLNCIVHIASNGRTQGKQEFVFLLLITVL